MLVEDLNDQISRLVQGLNMCMCMQFKGQSSCHQTQNEKKREATSIHCSIIINNKYKLLNHWFPCLILIEIKEKEINLK